MRLKAFIFFLLGLGVLAAIYTYRKYRVAPSLHFTRLEAVNAQGARQKIWHQPAHGTIVVFYASWCPDCARELPKLRAALSSTAQGFRVVALTDESLPTMRAYQQEARHPFEFFSLPLPFDHYGIHAIPTFYMLNSQGEPVYTKVGDVDWRSHEVVSALRNSAE